MKLISLFLAAAIMGLAPGSAQGGGERTRLAQGMKVPVVLAAGVQQHPGYTRLVFEISDPVKLRTFALAGPDRIVVAFPRLLWRLQKPVMDGSPSVSGYRYGQFRGGESRFVIDLKAPLLPRAPVLLPPSGGSGYRIVLDLYPATQPQFEQTAGWPPDLQRSPPPDIADLRGAEPSLLRKVVVIDPGHGGADGGTTGVSGNREKDLVLDVARRLAHVLKRRDYVVHLTRDTDTYIPLRERVAIARSYHADLLISLHADSNPNARMAGASVYTLSERGSDLEAAALARKENQSDLAAGLHVQGQEETVTHILVDLAQRETINRSERFAQRLVAQLGRATGMIPREPHRSAAFAVLKAPDVPAVLIELGYLSNGRDCAQMSAPRWRDSVASAIATAVDRQFATEFAGVSASR